MDIKNFVQIFNEILQSDLISWEKPKFKISGNSISLQSVVLTNLSIEQLENSEFVQIFNSKVNNQISKDLTTVYDLLNLLNSNLHLFAGEEGTLIHRFISELNNFIQVRNTELNGYLLGEDSFLSQMGYSVKKGIPLAHRQKILTAAVFQYGVPLVSNHLQWLIRSRRGKAGLEGAISRWREDLKFVKDFPIVIK